jgi:CheY-like chemotaxis protein
MLDIRYRIDKRRPLALSSRHLRHLVNDMKRPPLRSNSGLDASKNSIRLILSVDDEPLTLISRQKILKAAGYEVLSASNGEQALVFLAAVFFDLVIVDHKMPGMSGVEVARKIKASRPLVPVILLTDVPIEAASCVDCVVMKGDRPSLLLEKIRQLLAPPSTTVTE